MYVRPHVSAPLPLDRFPWNLIMGTFMKTCRETQNFIQIKNKISGISHEDLGSFRIVDSDVCSTTINGAHYCVSIAKLSVLMILLTPTYVWQQYKVTHCLWWLRKRAKMLCYSPSTLTALSTLIFRSLESKRKVMDSGKTCGFITFFYDGRNHCGTGTQNVLQS